MKHLDLLAKHVAAPGLPEVRVNRVTFSGPDMMNDALLSGSIDIASGGHAGVADDLGEDERIGSGGAWRRGDFNAAFTVPPFQTKQLRDPAIHTVLSSDDLIGPSSGGTAWTTKKFHDANPKL